MKALSITGTFSQFIQSSIISHQLMLREIEEVKFHSGRHPDDYVVRAFFEQMEIPEPDHWLDIPTMNWGTMIGELVEGIGNAIFEEKPDIILIYGDSDSAFAGALAANKHLIPIAHIEAGLRSFNIKVRKEVNRILTDRISSLLFCPSINALENLKKEGFDNFPCKYYNTGDVLQDAALFFGSISSSKSDIINRLNIKQSFALASISSQENLGDPLKLREIVKALNMINRNQQVVVPLHANTVKYLRENSIESQFNIIPPLNYFDMIELLKNCNIVLTDSNGIQREAFFYRKCSVTFRHDTEWPELFQNGFSMLGSTDSEFILIAYNEMVNRKPDFSINLYGNGKASERIAEIIKSWKG